MHEWSCEQGTTVNLTKNKLNKITKVNNQDNTEIQPNHKEYNAKLRENNSSTMVTTNNKITPVKSLTNWIIKRGGEAHAT